MIFKLLIIIFISYNFGTVYSFTDPAELRQYYRKNVKQMKNIGLSICEFPKEKWAGVCHDVLKKLREDDMYKYELFMSYKPFSDFDKLLEWKCSEEKFFFESSLEKIGNSEGLMQEMVPCFGRPALVDPHVHYNEYKYYNEFMIFPASIDSLYVFKRIPKSMDFYLLERCEKINWEEDSIAVNPELFTLPPPQITDGNDPDFLRSLSDMNLLTIDSNPRNVINTSDKNLYLLIRTTLMKTLEKNNLYVYTLEDLKRKRRDGYGSVCHLRIFHPDMKEIVLKDVKMNTIPTVNRKNGEERSRLSHNFKIAAGTSVDSVFILRRIKKTSEIDCQNGCQAVCKTPCRIVAFVKHLYPQHISYII